VADIEESFTGNSDDAALVDSKRFVSPNAKRKLRSRPTKHNFPNRAPLCFGGYFNGNNSRFVACRTLSAM